MADEHAHAHDHHPDGDHHPNPPDTSELWQDDAWHAIANSVARMWFITATVTAAGFIGVSAWILL